MLERFWFRTVGSLGYGVSAYSREDAERLLSELGYPRAGEHVVEVVESVRVQDLDLAHVVPNMGPISVRGVWFPQHNL